MNKRRLSLLVLLALTLSTLAAIPFVHSYTPQKIAEYMSSPLPTAPKAVLIGADFPVTVKDLSSDLAGGAASAWSGEIASIYGVFTIPLVNGTDTDGTWLLYFNIPEDVNTGLYNLTLTQGTMTIHQSNCVWVLDEYSDTLTFSHITDIHEPIGELLYPQFIMQSNFMNPDLVFATGDIVQTESNARAWAYLQYADLHYEVPFYALPGNHDYSGYGGKGYAMYGGKLNYTLVLGDFVIIAADSGENGYFNQDQVTWIEEQLQKYPDKVKILGFHHALLSAEYEEDLGSTTGGYIDVDWDNIDALADTMYFTWLGDDELPLEVTREVFRLIHEYDVRIILDGHVHRDMIYVVNDQHYFVTTSTCGGGLPETQRFGSRLINVESDGTVNLDSYATADIDNPPNNVPTGFVYYWYGSANDFSETAVSASVEYMLDMSLTEGRLIFKVSDEVPLESYTFEGTQPTRYETMVTDDGYVFDAYYAVEPQTMFSSTLRSDADSTAPEVQTELTTPQSSDSNAIFTVTATDSGWGVQTMTVRYSIDDGATWTTIDNGIGPTLTGEIFDCTIPEPTVTISLPNLDTTATILIEAEVSDYAGNSMSYASEALGVIEATEYQLSIESDPSPVTITVDGTEHSTTYTATLAEGEYTVTAPESVTIDGDEYLFEDWSTGATSTEITVSLSEDTSITVSYTLQETTGPDTTPDTEPDDTEDGGGGIPFPASYMLVGIAAASILISLKKQRSF